jgi:GNAT superfamily N-acetyltransferase
MGRRILFGTFTQLVFERGTAGEWPEDPFISRATVADLERLSPLLAPGHDHALRIESGDICLWARTPEGEPAGVQWVNMVLHSDPYLGEWSRCDPETVYINQFFVAPEHRRHGFGSRLMVAAVKAAEEEGRSRARGAIAPDNPQMARFMVSEGYEHIGTVYGLRLGRHLTLRYSRPVRRPRSDTAPASGGPRPRS